MRMILVLILLILVLAITGCHNRSPGLAELPGPGATFGSITTPQALLAWRGSRDAPVTKTASSVMLLMGEEFSSDLPHSGASINWGERSCTLTGCQAPLTYCFFDPVTGPGPAAHFTGIHLDLNWVAAQPVTPEGIYVGLADWDNDRWQWYGPYDASNTWLDIPEPGWPTSADGTNLVALANYSTEQAVLSQLRLKYINPGSADDAWIYYTHHTGDPEITSLSRMRVSGESEVLFAGDATNSYACPFIGRILGQTRLGYAYNDGTYWEIWRCELDGSNPQRLMQRSYDVRPAGWAPDGSAFLYLEGAGPGQYELWVRDTVTKENGRMAAPGTVVYDAGWDMTHAAHSYCALVVEKGDGPFGYSQISRIWTDAIQADLDPYVLLSADNEALFDPATFNLAGVNVPLRGLICVGDEMLKIQYTTMGQEDTDDLLETFVSANFSCPSVSPDGHFITYIMLELGEESVGQLSINQFTKPRREDVVELTSNVSGHVAWYDPTP